MTRLQEVQRLVLDGCEQLAVATTIQKMLRSANALHLGNAGQASVWTLETIAHERDYTTSHTSTALAVGDVAEHVVLSTSPS